MTLATGTIPINTKANSAKDIEQATWWQHQYQKIIIESGREGVASLVKWLILLQQQCNKTPSSVPLLLTGAYVCYELGHYHFALGYAERALVQAQGGHFPETNHTVVEGDEQVISEQDDPTLALIHLNQCYFYLAACHYHLSFSATLQRGGGDVRDHTTTRVEEEEKSHASLSIHYFERILDPSNPVPGPDDYYNLALAYGLNTRIERSNATPGFSLLHNINNKALTCINESISLNSTRAASWTALALLLGAQEEFAQALQVLDIGYDQLIQDLISRHPEGLLDFGGPLLDFRAKVEVLSLLLVRLEYESHVYGVRVALEGLQPVFSTYRKCFGKNGVGVATSPANDSSSPSVSTFPLVQGVEVQLLQIRLWLLSASFYRADMQYEQAFGCVQEAKSALTLVQEKLGYKSVQVYALSDTFPALTRKCIAYQLNIAVEDVRIRFYRLRRREEAQPSSPYSAYMSKATNLANMLCSRHPLPSATPSPVQGIPGNVYRSIATASPDEAVATSPEPARNPATRPPVSVVPVSGAANFAMLQRTLSVPIHLNTVSASISGNPSNQDAIKSTIHDNTLRRFKRDNHWSRVERRDYEALLRELQYLDLEYAGGWSECKATSLAVQELAFLWLTIYRFMTRSGESHEKAVAGNGGILHAPSSWHRLLRDFFRDDGDSFVGVYGIGEGNALSPHLQSVLGKGPCALTLACELSSPKLR